MLFLIHLILTTILMLHRNLRRALGARSLHYLENQFSLQGRACIVSGGGTGIGFAMAKGLAQAGAAVTITGRRQAVLDEAVAEIKMVQPNTVGIACDVTQLDQIENLVQQSEVHTGIPPTILINNAGINVRQKPENLDQGHWDVSLNLMLTAPFYLTRAMSKNFESEGYGRVISIASLQSYRAFPDSIPYAAAKSGILGLTRALAEAYGSSNNNVTCNAIAPGYVKTELTKSVFEDAERSQRLADATLIGRNSVPEDLVGAAIFLSSPAASYITGQTLPVDGGFTAMGMR